MIRGLYTSATGMNQQIKNMDIIANNIANVDTNGYKEDTLITKSFKDELTKRISSKDKNNIGGMSLGVNTDEIHINFTQGPIKQTNGQLDVALKGEGFFAVQIKTSTGQTVEKYTRDGAFMTDSTGKLITKDGYQVLNKEGKTIQMQNGDVRIDSEGSIFINDEFVDKIKVVDFENKDTLKKFGNNLLDKDNTTKPKDFSGEIVQGAIESSNASPIKEMLKMIVATRSYETNQKLIQIHDQTIGKAVNEVGKV